MKALLAVIVLELLLVGCGQGPAKKPLLEDFESLKALAEKGDAKAQYTLGVMYYNGRGVEQDSKEAFKWFQKTADQGLAMEQYTLGEAKEWSRTSRKRISGTRKLPIRDMQMRKPALG